MKRAIAIFCILMATAAGSVSAAESAKNPMFQLEPFQDGDVVVNAGDSITHTSKFSMFLTVFYMTRYPDRKVEFYNCGIGGGTASTLRNRIDWDIAPHKPTVVTVMVGMNDSGRNLYKAEMKGPDVESKRKEIVKKFKSNFDALVADLRAKTGARIILLTPSPYDQTAKMDRPGDYASNDVLGSLAEYIYHFAAVDNDVKVIDFHDPMNAINEREQKKEPSFTLCGGDRMHPSDTGHLTMMYLFLKAQGVRPDVFSCEIDAKAATAKADNATVENIQPTASGLAFKLTPAALPFPVIDDWKRLLTLVPFQGDLNGSLLRVKNLDPGTYAVTMDGAAVGRWSAAELAKGVDLSLTKDSPSFRQAMSVLTLGFKWNDLVQKLRSEAFTERRLREKGVDMKDAAAVQAKIDAILADPNERDYSKKFAKEFLEVRPKHAEMERQVKNIEAQMREKARPAAQAVELKKI